MHCVFKFNNYYWHFPNNLKYGLTYLQPVLNNRLNNR